jgi:hypothetical protein
MKQDDLSALVHHGHILVESNKGMYGLPQSDRIANERLVKHLAKYDFHPSKHTDGL